MEWIHLSQDWGG